MWHATWKIFDDCAYMWQCLYGKDANWSCMSIKYSRGEPQYGSVACPLRFRVVYYFLLSRLHNCTSLNQVLNRFVLICIIVLFVFDYDHYGFSKLLELMKQEPFLKLVQVIWEVKSKTIFKNLKIWDLVCMTRVTHIPWLESNQTYENMMILVYVTWITIYTWFEPCNFVTRIIRCTWLESHILCYPLSHLIWITHPAWLKSQVASLFPVWLWSIWFESRFIHDSNHEPPWLKSKL